MVFVEARMNLKKRSSQKTGTHLTKSSPDPAESPSCEINISMTIVGLYFQYAYYTMAFIAHWRNLVLYVEFVIITIRLVA